MTVHSIKTEMVDRRKRKPPCPSIVVRTTKPPHFEQPSLTTKFGRLRQEVKAWLKAGAVIVPGAVRAQRLAQCEACEFYDPAGNWGLGECRAPGCGCSRVKLSLASAKCPHPKGPKWGAWVKD